MGQRLTRGGQEAEGVGKAGESSLCSFLALGIIRCLSLG